MEVNQEIMGGIVTFYVSMRVLLWTEYTHVTFIINISYSNIHHS